MSGCVIRWGEVVTQLLSDAQTYWNGLDGVGVAQLIVAAGLAMLALRRFGKVAIATFSRPVKQARQYNMTGSMVQTMTIMMFLYLTFVAFEAYSAVNALFGQNNWQFFVDIVVVVIFYLLFVSLMGQLLFDLHYHLPLGGAPKSSVRYLFRVFSDRGFALSEMLLSMPFLVWAKIDLQMANPAVLEAARRYLPY
jgi:hypothetical protein